MLTVREVAEKNLCISCGACKAVCPVGCISYIKRNGMYIPNIKQAVCVECGKCYRICPGRGFNYIKNTSRETFESTIAGNGIKNLSSKTKDKDILNKSTSGGVITSLVKTLLKNNIYDNAFLVNTYNYEGQVHSTKIKNPEEMDNTPKSRYIPILQTEAFEEMINTRHRIILVGTPCFVHAIHNVIDMYQLERNRFLIIGLFCDKTMNYNVVNYFDYIVKLKKGKEKSLDNLFFRTKERSGWPGDVCLITNDGNRIDLSNNERIWIKEFFVPLRCIYCIDKLNKEADISVGDDYTHGYKGDARSSLIIRTEQGERAFSYADDCLESYEINMDEIVKSQKITEKKKNYLFNIIDQAIEEKYEFIDTDLRQLEEYSKELEAVKNKIINGQNCNFKEIYNYNRKGRMLISIKKIIKVILNRR